MSNIKIGDKNNIKNSVIGDNNSTPTDEKFATKHPVITGLLISLITGFIMLFSFWKNIITWIESITK